MTTLLLLVLLQMRVPDAEGFVGKPAGAPLSGALLEQRTNAVASLLRCPVCQGMSVADSPAAMAVNMKGQVRDLLARGYSEEQILRYFERSYGEFVLLRPKFQGMNALVWLLPLGALLVGVGILLWRTRAAPPASVPPPAADPYVDRVRELVEK